MKKILILSFIGLILCSFSNQIEKPNIALKNTIWETTNNVAGLTTVTVISFTSEDKCEIIYIGGGVSTSVYECIYVRDKNRLRIIPSNEAWGGQTKQGFEIILIDENTIAFDNNITNDKTRPTDVTKMTKYKRMK